MFGFFRPKEKTKPRQSELDIGLITAFRLPRFSDEEQASLNELLNAADRAVDIRANVGATTYAVRWVVSDTFLEARAINQFERLLRILPPIEADAAREYGAKALEADLARAVYYHRDTQRGNVQSKIDRNVFGVLQTQQQPASPVA